MKTSEFPFWLDLVLRSLPPILVVGGWAIAYHLQGLQARRKLLREEAEGMRDAVAELHQAALEFHTNVYEESKRLLILRSITDLERRRQMLPLMGRSRSFLGKDYAPVSSIEAVTIAPQLIANLNQAITLEHFDDPSAEPLKAADPQVLKIGQEAAELTAAIDRAFVAALD